MHGCEHGEGGPPDFDSDHDSDFGSFAPVSRSCFSISPLQRTGYASEPFTWKVYNRDSRSAFAVNQEEFNLTTPWHKAISGTIRPR